MIADEEFGSLTGSVSALNYSGTYGREIGMSNVDSGGGEYHGYNRTVTNPSIAYGGMRNDAGVGRLAVFGGRGYFEWR